MKGLIKNPLFAVSIKLEKNQKKLILKEESRYAKDNVKLFLFGFSKAKKKRFLSIILSLVFIFFNLEVSMTDMIYLAYAM
jgi:hypothetical protein